MTDLHSIIFLGGPQPSILQEVSIPIWTNSECRLKYGAAAPGGIVEHMLCAGRASMDSCSVSIRLLIILYFRHLAICRKSENIYEFISNQLTGLISCKMVITPSLV